MRINGFRELADELDRVAHTFDPEEYREAISAGIDEALDEQIVDMMRTRARRHVTREAAQSIGHESGSWHGDTYHHTVGATDDLVKYHEFGTGGQADGNGRVTGTTYDGRPGYHIYPSSKQALAIPSRRWTGPSYMVNRDENNVVLNYVVHPGVSGKHFMQNTLEHNSDVIRGYILNEIRKRQE